MKNTSRVQEIPAPSLRSVIRSQIRRYADGVDVVVTVAAVRAGLPLRELTELREVLDLSMERIAAKVGMSRATLHRRQKSGVLSSDESDKALRLARIAGHAIAVFGADAEARAWLHAPQVGLGGEIPLDYAETEVGAREVENLLGRIDHGVYA